MLTRSSFNSSHAKSLKYQEMITAGLQHHNYLVQYVHVEWNVRGSWILFFIHSWSHLHHYCTRQLVGKKKLCYSLPSLDSRPQGKAVERAGVEAIHCLTGRQLNSDDYLCHYYVIFQI